MAGPSLELGFQCMSLHEAHCNMIVSTLAISNVGPIPHLEWSILDDLNRHKCFQSKLESLNIRVSKEVVLPQQSLITTVALPLP